MVWEPDLKARHTNGMWQDFLFSVSENSGSVRKTYPGSTWVDSKMVEVCLWLLVDCFSFLVFQVLPAISCILHWHIMREAYRYGFSSEWVKYSLKSRAMKLFRFYRFPGALFPWTCRGLAGSIFTYNFIFVVLHSAAMYHHNRAYLIAGCALPADMWYLFCLICVLSES